MEHPLCRSHVLARLWMNYSALQRGLNPCCRLSGNQGLFKTTAHTFQTCEAFAEASLSGAQFGSTYPTTDTLKEVMYFTTAVTAAVCIAAIPNAPTLLTVRHPRSNSILIRNRTECLHQNHQIW